MARKKQRRKRRSKFERWFKNNWAYILILVAVLVLTVFAYITEIK